MKKIVCGVIPSKLDGTEYNAEDFILNSQDNLPDEFSYTDYCINVQNQGNKPYCVPYSLNINRTWFSNISGLNEPELSYEFLFNSQKDNNAVGMEPKEALSILTKIGWTDNKYYKNGKLKENAPFYKIKTYAMCRSYLVAKKSLFLNGPLLFCLPVCNSSNTFWKGGTIVGYHAVACIGWNETGFILQNSWGTSWAEGGYTTISYEDFNKYTQECWTVINS